MIEKIFLYYINYTTNTNHRTLNNKKVLVLKHWFYFYFIE